MKKLTKAVLGLVLALVFGTIVGSNAVDASERVGNRYDGLRVSIHSVMRPGFVVDWSQSNHNNVIMHWNSWSWNQRWRMSYQPASDSYILMTGGDHPGGAGYAAFLTAREHSGSWSVGTELSSLDAMQWRLIPSGNHAYGRVYMLENVRFRRVMDIHGASLFDGAPLILYNRNNTNNQRFIIHVHGEM